MRIAALAYAIWTLKDGRMRVWTLDRAGGAEVLMNETPRFTAWGMTRSSY
jgi:hypothetical protein